VAYQFHNRVKLDGYDFKDCQFTVHVATGISPVTVATGAVAVTQDTSAPNQVKLTSAGDEIVGILLQVEDRTSAEAQIVGTVALEFSELLAIDPAATGAAIPVVGSRIKGGAGGKVQACDGTETFFAMAPRVWEVRGSSVVALRH
jgi:hypothetical protein